MECLIELSVIFVERASPTTLRAGRDDGIRTSDPLTPSQVRHQFEITEGHRFESRRAQQPYLLKVRRFNHGVLKGGDRIAGSVFTWICRRAMSQCPSIFSRLSS